MIFPPQYIENGARARDIMELRTAASRYTSFHNNKYGSSLENKKNKYFLATPNLFLRIVSNFLWDFEIKIDTPHLFLSYHLSLLGGEASHNLRYERKKKWIVSIFI